MSDLRRRALERTRSAAPGDHAAQAELLRARLRAGELSPERLGLLAALGDPGACLVLDLSPVPLEAQAGLELLVAAVQPCGKAPLVRAALAAVEPLLALLEEHAPWEHRPHGALEAARGWLSEPREASRVGARLAAEEAQRAGEELMDLPQPTLPTGTLELGFLAWATQAVADLAGELRPHALGHFALRALRDADSIYEELGVAGSGERALAALRAWCLGEPEPRPALRLPAQVESPPQ